MPLTYQLDSARRLVMTTGAGVLTDADVLAHKQALVADAAFVAGMREISDLRGVKDVRITSTGVGLMVGIDERHAKAFAGCKLAIVTGQDLLYGMSRMYQQVADAVRPNVGVFKDYDEAMTWLEGIDE